MVNDTKFSVKIEWDESTLAESDVQFSVHKLMPCNWNPKKIIKAKWRDYYLVHLHVMNTWNRICSSDIDRVLPNQKLL